MEGVGARLGRSSTRYGPATVFTGPVRKWKKKWIQVTPPNTAAAASNDKHNNNQHQSNGNSSSNGNNNNASHILLYKWAPISQSHNTSANDSSNGHAKEDGSGEVDEEPPRRKMKYIPVAVLEEQSNEEETDEAKPMETDPHAADEPSSKIDKPDINDMPQEENQVTGNIDLERQDLNKSSVGLSLNLNDRDGNGDDDGEEESEDAKDEMNDDRSDRVSETR